MSRGVLSINPKNELSMQEKLFFHFEWFTFTSLVVWSNQTNWESKETEFTFLSTNEIPLFEAFSKFILCWHVLFAVLMVNNVKLLVKVASVKSNYQYTKLIIYWSPPFSFSPIRVWKERGKPWIWHIVTLEAKHSKILEKSINNFRWVNFFALWLSISFH